ncbi:hypothetical protein [Kamptonema formosum]
MRVCQMLSNLYQPSVSLRYCVKNYLCSSWHKR